MAERTALDSRSWDHAADRARDGPEDGPSELRDPETCFGEGKVESKHHESAADLIWKEKLDMCVTPTEAAVSLLATGVLVGLVLALG
jgi:hypothetical protein